MYSNHPLAYFGYPVSTYFGCRIKQCSKIIGILRYGPKHCRALGRRVSLGIRSFLP